MSQVKFVITKKSRLTDRPYTGRSCKKAKVTPGLVYPTFGSAWNDVLKLQKANPCGWEVRPVIY